MVFPLPEWLLRMPHGPERFRAETQFFTQLMCAYASPSGSMRSVSEVLDINYRTLQGQVNHHRTRGFTKDTRQRITRRLGSEFIPPHARDTI